MPSNSTSAELTAHERLSRLLNMGAYGERLAQEILDQYLHEVFKNSIEGEFLG